MGSRWKGVLVIVGVFLLALAMMVLTFGLQTQGTEKIRPAPSFSAVDQIGQGFSLIDFNGKVVVLHITQLEDPLCLECEASIVGELQEIKKLADRGDPDIVVITLNLRKSPGSEPGWVMANDNYGLNVTWRWVEEFDPYPIGKEYLDYWQVNGAFSDPTILMIDGQQNVVAVSHVYVVGRGVMDGIQGVEKMISLKRTIASGGLGDTMIGSTSQTSLGLPSIVGLGIITSFSPCSLALLFTMMMYIASSDGKGANRSRKVEIMGNVATGIAFTFGMSMVFLVIGLLIGYLGGFLEFSSSFYLVSGGVLALLGVNSIWPIKEHILRSREEAADCPGCSCGDVPKGALGRNGSRLITGLQGRSRLLAGFFLGVLFSIGWAPCALSLVFPMVLLIFALGVPAIESGLLLFAFGLAHGLVVIPSCAVSGEVRHRLARGLTGNAFMIKVGFGGAVIVMGLLFALRFWGVQLW